MRSRPSSTCAATPSRGRRRRCAPRWPRAEVGDDVFGDDPSVNALQEKIAALLGKEAALFVASGTQSNLVAIMSHCGRGDEYIVGQMAHTYRWEGGGAAVLGSVQPQPLEHEADGTLALAAIEAAIKPDDAHFAQQPAALPREHDRRQGAADRLPRRRRARWRKQRGLATHLDGARLFNAAVALGGDPRATARAIAAPFDSVSVCFSKGLGAPVGSALVGSRELHRRRAPLAQDGRRRHAPGRRPRRGGAARARAPRRPPRRRPRAGEPPRRRPARPARAHGRARRRPTSSSPTWQATAPPA